MGAAPERESPGRSFNCSPWKKKKVENKKKKKTTLADLRELRAAWGDPAQGGAGNVVRERVCVPVAVGTERGHGTPAGNLPGRESAPQKGPRASCTELSPALSPGWQEAAPLLGQLEELRGEARWQWLGPVLCCLAVETWDLGALVSGQHGATRAGGARSW